jgi:type I restriction enzyme S subunit
MAELPAGWATLPFGELNTFRAASIDPASFPAETFELYSVPAFGSRIPESVRGALIGSSKQVVSPADVLICKINPRINRVWLVAEKGSARQIASSEWIGFRVPGQCPQYYRHYYSSPAFRDQICADLTGVGGSLTRAQPKRVDDFLVPVAPRSEQQRIADKLDTVLARLDACRDRLDRVAPLLKRFRQSVLAAATSGRLTEDWRQLHETIESGRHVVARDAAAKAKLLVDDASLAKKKSTANAEVDAAFSFHLPPSWVFTSWGRLSEWITYGFTRPMPAAAVGRKLVTAKDVHPFELRLGSCGFTTEAAFNALSPKDQPRRGDLLITKDGTIGRAALVMSDESFCINQSVAVVWLRSTSMNRRFLELVANVDYTQRFVLEKAKGMAIQHLSITDFAQCPIPVPPIVEQEEIVRRVETLFAFADRLEARLAQAQTAIDRLTPSLLAKAFRGELVPQDPADEPAAELLKRLAQSRPTTAPETRRPRQRQPA